MTATIPPNNVQPGDPNHILYHNNIADVLTQLSTAGTVTLDTTASDIQPLGTQAAGNSSKAAAANHVHPTTGVALLAGATFTGYLAPAVVTLTDAATIAVDASLGNHMRVTLAGNRTLGNPSNSVDGQRIMFEVIQDGTGSRTLAYGTNYAFSTDLPSPTLTTTASKRDLLGFTYSGSMSKWLFTGIIHSY